ncbi:hypothetical protein ILYODFUR_029179 [Ilyodon furcidens]|uniref:Uncharacterized protein n=1 Tax=Ilyodon furcidens TaxID=33524 RepID=A0ABV0SQH3_9TELE
MMGGCYVEKGMVFTERYVARPGFLLVRVRLIPLLAPLWMHPFRCSMQVGAAASGSLAGNTDNVGHWRQTEVLMHAEECVALPASSKQAPQGPLSYCTQIPLCMCGANASYCALSY